MHACNDTKTVDYWEFQNGMACHLQLHTTQGLCSQTIPSQDLKQRHSGILDNFLELQIPVLNHLKQTNEVSWFYSRNVRSRFLCLNQRNHNWLTELPPIKIVSAAPSKVHIKTQWLSHRWWLEDDMQSRPELSQGFTVEVTGRAARGGMINRWMETVFFIIPWHQDHLSFKT